MLEDAIMTNPNNTKIMNEMDKKNGLKNGHFVVKMAISAKLVYPRTFMAILKMANLFWKSPFMTNHQKNNNIK